MNIGRLHKVELRKLWKHEEYDFSSWLARPENLGLLSDEIGIGLIDPQTETPVGKFSTDIVAEEDGTGRKVLIENQLEATNHDHLGKLVTYGAGIDAEILIWIVKRAREEHEQAVDWMNERTDEHLNIFLVQIEAWQIGDSDPAPKFNVIAKPNDWAKMIKRATQSKELSDYNLLQGKYWDGLKEADGKGILGNRKGFPQHWFDVSLGTTVAHISLTLNKNANQIACEVYISKDREKDIFDGLYAKKANIEAEVGHSLEWLRLDDRTASRVKLVRSADILDENRWPEYFDWMLTNVSLFKKIFIKYLK